MGKRKRRETPPLTLPAELLELIVHFACRSSIEGLTLADFDFKTTLNVASVSKHFYRLSHPLLYTHVRLTKPSDLVLYARTAATRPDLTKLTQSLWMGPDQDHEETPASWPLNIDGTEIKSSITDPQKLPIGVDVGTYWSFAAGVPLATEEWIAEAAKRVIREGCRKVGKAGHPLHGRGVSLRRGGAFSFDGRRLSPHEGRLRVYQVQQLLDAFLEGVRKRQEWGSSPHATHSTTCDRSAQSTRKTGVPPTPPSAFAWHGSSSTSPLRAHNVFDHFDHPMVYNRTEDPSSRSKDDWDIIKCSVTGDLEYSITIRDDPYECQVSEESTSSEVCDSSDEGQSSDDDDTSETGQSSEDCDLDSDSDAFRTTPELFFDSDNIGEWFLDLFDVVHAEVDLGAPTIGALQVLARIILARSPRLVCLALTSYLQKVVSGQGFGPVVERLQLMALGPPGRGYQGTMCFAYRGLASVRKLQLWGPEPHGEIAWSIDEWNALPALESVDCTWTEPWVDPFDSGRGPFAFLAETHTVAAVERLLGCRGGRSRPKKPFELTVWAHHERVREFERLATKEVRNHPRLTIKRLPQELEGEENCDPRTGTLALARIREQWEAESREILGTE